MGSRKTTKQSLLIGDDLLIEILSRISTPVVAIRCKLVCKSWCSLISSRYFISRFKQQHIKHPKPLSGMLVSTVRRVSLENPYDNEFNFRGFDLDYLPDKNKDINVLASCNDLILCSAKINQSFKYNYYLCNPFTMQWIALPPPTPRLSFCRTGLVCEPYNGGDRFRYRIVRFCPEYQEQERCLVEIYCSETSEWILCDDLDNEYFWYESPIAAYNGKLYWVNKGGRYLITYDPFDMRQTSMRLINGADSDNLWCGYRCHVGECEGVLRVTRYEPWQRLPGNGKIFKGISVWELQEEEVIFKEHVAFNEDISMSSLIDMRELTGFHSMNKDVLFLRIRNSLASFNMKTRELKVEAQFKNSYMLCNAFTLQLPWWPTPILSASPTPTL